MSYPSHVKRWVQHFCTSVNFISIFSYLFFSLSSCTWHKTQSFSVTTISYCTLSHLQANRVILNNFKQNCRCSQILLQFPNTKFHKNPFGGSRAFTDRQTDRLRYGRIFRGHVRLSHLSLKCVWRKTPKQVVQHAILKWLRSEYDGCLLRQVLAIFGGYVPNWKQYSYVRT